MSQIFVLNSDEQFDSFIQEHERELVVIHFGAEWAPQSKQVNDILSELVGSSPNIHFAYVEAERIPQISQKYKIVAVPTIVFIKRKEVVQTIKGGHPKDLFNAITALTLSNTISQKETLEDRLKKLINTDTIMLFLKGSPTEPQCGFSRKIVQILLEAGAVYQSFDILKDSEVREGLKTYSNWPTYPQLYIKGELVGGLDIVQEMAQSGDLANLISEAQSNKQKQLEERLQSLIEMDKVVLFMKGNPDTPKCGFSRNTVEILKRDNIPFSHFDILTDNDVREGLKTYKNWPTYPQLYVNGELIGGFDIIKELDATGDLVATCTV